MGYRPNRAPCKLDFTGTEYDGLEVVTRPMPMSVLLDVMAGSTKQDLESFRQTAATFAYALDSWNVEDDDGQPVPADLDGLLSQDPRFVSAVIMAWVASLLGGVT